MKISYKVLFAAVLSIAGTNAFAATADITGLATTNYVKGAINSLDVTTATGSGNVVTSVTQEDGKIIVKKETTLGSLATRNDVTSAQITGNIDVSRITKGQTTDNIVNVTVSDGTDGKQVVTYSKGDATSTDNYPSVKAANQIAAAAAANATMELTSDVATLQGDLTALTQTVENNKGAADDAIKGLTGTGTGTTAGNGMVKTVTQEKGVVTATRGLVATADIADGAVDGKKIKDGAIAAGSNIKVTKDATTGVVTVANTYSYTLPAANDTTRGGVVTGGDITATSGTLTITDGKVTGKKIASDAITGTNGITISKNATTGAVVVDGAGTKYTLPTATTTVKGGIMATSEIAVASDGKATIGTGAVTEGKIAANAITSAKIKDGEVKEADIGAQAVSTAKIKRPTTTECASGKCALVDLGTGAQWLPIVNEYPQPQQ